MMPDAPIPQMRPFERLSAGLHRLCPDGWDGIALDAASLRDATRLGVQSAVAATVAYLILNAVGSDGAFVGILSAILILQPSVGGTLSAARTRIVASAIGAVIGVICLFTLPSGVGTAVGLLTTMFVLNAFSALKPEWSYGVVSAVALTLSSGDDLVMAMLDRVLTIALGAGVGLIVAALVWPNRATDRFSDHLSAALRQMAHGVDQVAHKIRLPERALGYDGRDAVDDALTNAREALEAAKMADTTSLQTRLEAARSVKDAVWLLDAATSKTGDMSGGGASTARAVAAFGVAAGRVLDDLAAGRPAHLALDRVERLADLARSRLNRFDATDISHLQAISFAIEQLWSDLTRLVDAQYAQRPAPSWRDRMAARVRAG